MKKWSIFLILILYYSVHGQEIYLKTGKNYTNYKYTSFSPLPSSIDLNAGQGVFYEFGINNFFKKEGVLGYKIGFSLNEYNAIASSISNFYSWNTSSMGVQGMAFFRPIKKSRLNLDLFGGLLFNKMIYGKQIINNTVYDLHSSNEFNGIYVHPIVGTELGIRCIDKMSILIGYQFSFSTGVLQNRLREQTTFINHQIQFGIQYKL